ncbi:unnamed protein product [Bursaphelenchus xylophilus]|uniref:(pine wood nematode) hypothetical protein n=1 Tax=Bursaphelenchus xylophilus TaxID=6326 RepID=A0A1I7RIB9_BURXY|nr:unnamed protein product [Bursaphelenchus xylophilus]CAG9115007.1 unnamed protein product [Bursaphelenchus xylophilus]
MSDALKTAEYVVFGVAIFGDLLYFLFIRYKTDPAMDVYRILLYYNLYADIALTVLSFLCKPFIAVYNGNVYFIGDTPFKTENPAACFILFSFYIYCFYQTFIVCPMSYYFRYLAVCKAQILTNCKFIALAIFWTLIAAGSVTVFATFVMYPTEDRLVDFYSTKDTFDTTILKDIHRSFAGLSSSRDSSLLLQLCMWNGFLIVATSYVVTFYFMHKVTSSFRIRHKGTKWHDINKQIARVMLVQASVPMLLMAPAYLILFQMFIFGMESDLKQYLMNVLMTLAPLVNPYVGILMVKSYRNALCGCFSSSREQEVYPEEQTADEDVI